MIETTDEAFDKTIVDQTETGQSKTDQTETGQSKIDQTETSQSKIDQTETGQSQTISTTKPEAQKPKVLFHRHQKILDRHIWYKYFAFSTAKT